MQLPQSSPLVVSVAVAGAVFPPPPSVVRPPGGMTFWRVPALPAVTPTLTVQLPPPGIVPPASCTVVAVWLTVPEQVVAAVPATVVRPVGSVSVKAAPVSAVCRGLVSVMVRVDGSPTATVGGENVFVRPTLTVTTTRVASAGTVFPPALSVVRPPAGMTFS